MFYLCFYCFYVVKKYLHPSVSFDLESLLDTKCCTEYCKQRGARGRCLLLGKLLQAKRNNKITSYSNNTLGYLLAHIVIRNKWIMQ